MLIFKQFSDKRHASLNLDKAFMRLLGGGRPIDRSPVLESIYGDHFVATVLAELNADWGSGGMFERRENVFAGSYLARGGKWNHLGIDLYVPAGTIMSASRRLNVLDIRSDQSEGGWGHHVFARAVDTPYVNVIGHVDPFPDLCIGDTIKAGEDFALIDVPKTNGGWFAHGHWQTMSLEAWGHYRLNLDELDGYCSDEDLPAARKRFVDPVEVGIVRLV